MLFRSDVWHGAAENTHPDGKNRYIMQVHFGNRYISSQLPDIGESGAFSEEVRSHLTRRQEQLLGRTEPWYRQGSYNISPFGHGAEQSISKGLPQAHSLFRGEMVGPGSRL